MQCPRCQAENREGRRFCGECGLSFASACPSCGFLNEGNEKFCGGCGRSLSAAPTPAAPRFTLPHAYTPKHLAEKILTSKAALEGERKQVTVLFADLKGSMELLADRDPEEARKILDPVLERMMEAVHRYEGTVNQVMGDGIMALFGAPLAHEDHAVRACYAALRMQESVTKYAEEVRRSHAAVVKIRVGLNSGEVVVRAIGNDLHMDYTAVGQTTHLAARMEQLADPGAIVITPDTLALAEGYIEVKPLGPVPVKGLADAVEVYEVVGAGPARTRLQATARRGLTRFVGRDAELAQLGRAQRLAGNGQGQIAAIVGEAGVGKSRLVYEFTHSHRLQGWLVLESASVSYGKATSYLPVINLLKGYFKIQDGDDLRGIREKVTGKLLTLDRALEPTLPALLALLDAPLDDPAWQALDPGQRRQRTLDALKRLLLREAREHPLLLIFEDLHWIDVETQALLEALVDSLGSARLLLLVNYRPEYQHSWGSKTSYSQLRLDALPAESAGELLEALLGDDPGLAPLKQLLVKRGNPFFLEETIRTLAETKVLVGERARYRLTQPVQAIQIPATVQVILAARIDRLSPEDKRLLQVASVVGKDVPWVLLQAIADLPDEAVRHGLDRLQAAEFLYETRLFPELEFSFKHALTHEVTYGGLLLERRHALHARIVDVIERLSGERLPEQVERLAHHALQADRWDKALIYARQAGAKAAARWALRQAGTHLEGALTAIRHLPEGRETAEHAIDVRVELRNAIQPLGELERSLDCLTEAMTVAERLGDARRSANISLLLSAAYWMMGHSDRAASSLDRALAIAESTGDSLLRLLAGGQMGYVYHDRGDFRQAATTFREHSAALDAAGVGSSKLGVSPRAVTIRTYLAWSLAELGEFMEARRVAEESLRLARAQENPWAVMLAYMGTGMVDIRQGDAIAAIPPLERGLDVCHTFGFTALGFHGTAASLGAAYALANRSEEALPLLRQVSAQAARMKAVSDHLLGAIPLGEVYLQTGRTGEALELGAQSLDLARGHGQCGYEVYAHRLLGDVYARSDSPEVARAPTHYLSALALAEPRGMRPLVAHCHLGLGKLYRRTGKHEQAQEHLTTATTMYREMGMQFWVEKAETEEQALT
jgi:class 3 adenylate cyclase/tetratricopeptide (TPR) repeat protein